MIPLDPKTTALILIDLQKGILGRPIAPYSADQVMKTSNELTQRFRRAGALVVLVNVAFAPDFADALRQEVDESRPLPAGGHPQEFSELVDGLAEPSDLLITKKQWGAFYGTELDLQLRRRGIRTLVVGGVATNMGVESTVRQASEFGYTLIIAEDATSSMSVEMHEFSIKNIMPRIARVRKAADIDFQ